jgi:murein DD-endopeptidase MepM/ murein hydrolase activator NlpD
LAFFASAFAVSVSLIAAVVPAINLPGHAGGEQPLFPAPPGYLLPWAGGELHDVTQGEETTFTHNGPAAYAFDFNLNYETVVAARSGKVVMVRQDSNSGGCSPAYQNAANYVVIDHGDGTSALYLHLAQNSVTVGPGETVAQGDPIALSGETGVTCSEQDGGPGPHLHFQVEETVDNKYFTQSLPVAFDDIADGDGVPRDGRTYVSANYGRGRPQKIALTPHHVPRVFNPTARPANPMLIEAEHLPDPLAPGGSETPAETATPTPLPLIEHQGTLTPEPEDTPEPTETPVDTPVPPSADTATPAPPSPAVPLSTQVPTTVPPTATPPPTDTPIPPPDTPTPVPPTDTPTDTPTPVPPTETPADTPVP